LIETNSRLEIAMTIPDLFRFGFFALLTCCGNQLTLGQAPLKPSAQYELGEIKVSIPTADEPRVKEFGPETIKAAAKYLEIGAVSWSRGRACVNCHTTGPYLTEYTAWSKHFGKPSEEVQASFIAALPKEIAEVKETEKNGHKYYPNTFFSVWRSAGLAEWDRHVTGKLADVTDRSLRDMFERQSESGAFVSHGEVEVPHITTDFELSLQAARAITAAPGWLAGLEDEKLLARIVKLKEWLRTAPPKNDFDRILKLQLVHYLPELVPQAERDAALKLLSSKQHADGGWSTRDMSPIDDWHFEMSPFVLKLINNLPDAEKPESDAYMTAHAIVLMRQNDVPVSDPRIQKGLAWLKREQRESGRWWMHSLYRGNFHYITYIATVEALKALDLCGELDGIAADKN
jgi:squalene-hopene/tetraprenyl-beta-curcumene cyclase